ncbi:DUF6602 domain-containing protein [Sorangium sp. So ce1153]|uniref:DUF6602 domain-containing protein n=1 Tax=Sorangium sp. So ce1153 TaxID=3133333 RepID=UPI003F5D5FC6
MARPYREIIRIESDKMRAAAVSAFDHPTGKGDHREDLVRGMLSERIGSAFDVVKAEVIDSFDNTTGEYDAVIFDHRTASCVLSEAGRKVVRVESVVMTIEIKSRLETEHLKETLRRGNKQLSSLRRCYSPNQVLRAKGPDAPNWDETQKIFRDGLSPLCAHVSIPEVINCVFAFDGITLNAAANELCHPMVDAVCVLGRYTVAKNRGGFEHDGSELIVMGENEDALGGFLQLIETVLERYLESRFWVSPDWRRYYAASSNIDATGSRSEQGAI